MAGATLTIFRVTNCSRDYKYFSCLKNNCTWRIGEFVFAKPIENSIKVMSLKKEAQQILFLSSRDFHKEFYLFCDLYKESQTMYLRFHQSIF